MSTAQVKGVFDAHARKFDAWFVQNERIYLSELDAIRAAGPRGRIIDVGVGSGIFAHKLGTRLGVDVSREMLALCTKRGVPAVLSDAKYLPIRDGAFDTVVISFTICFVDDAPAMLKEAASVLVGEGRLIRGDTTSDSIWGRVYMREGKKGDPFYSRARFFTLRRSLSLLSKAGFRLDGAFGSLSFGPTQEQRVEKAVKVNVEDKVDAERYGFLCLRALKK